MLFMAVQPIRHFRNAEGTGAEMCPAIISGWLLGTRRSAIGHFFRVLSNKPRSLGERLHDPVFLSFLKCRMFRRKSISPVFLLFNFQSVSGHFPYLTLPKPVMPLNKWVLLHKVTFIWTKRNLLISLARSLVAWRKLELLPSQNCSPKLLTNVYLQLISY